MSGRTKNCICKLCENLFSDDEMSEEHYPARSVGNNDIVALDIIKLFDSFRSPAIHNEILMRTANGENIHCIADDIFDNRLSRTLYKEGRTARTLCLQCNHFLGDYDQAYKKFFLSDGDPKKVNGFAYVTKLKIIKSIFGKFLSVPEASDEHFDFLDFIKDKEMRDYSGIWRLYFVKRDFSSDLMGMKDIGTGKATFDEGVVYEMSDDKFIFNLMNFEKHSSFVMNNIFDILQKNYTLVTGVGRDGGYHASIIMSRLFKTMYDSENNN